MSEELILYAEGPCDNANFSQIRQEIEFLPCSCPVGFKQKPSEQSKCECTCDPMIHHYITDCNIQNETLVREGDFWITYINESDDYLIYPHCPYDYCHPPSYMINIDLNIPDGADAQCAFNRSGVLCGACKPGLSLSLDSSDCVACSSYWPVTFIVIIIAGFLAGLALVALVLILNLTVAVGTLNGIIFFANIVNVNRTILFPFSTPNFVTVFISWLNLELGFDICFFEGMDAYWKTWLQLVFPAYIIFLVVMVIVLGEYSQRFAHLIGKKNPVATLATLILLSYNKLLQSLIGALSFAVLDYPDGSHEIVWLPDANIKYFRGKHIPLFIAALVILTVCVSYTLLLFSWQWLLHCQDSKLFRWVGNQKLHLFIKPYHAPYTIKHRYWTGLLLLVRATLSISSAVNVSGDPGVDLLVMGFIMICLLLHVGRCSPVYEKSTIELLEITFYGNITLLFAIRFYTLEAEKVQTSVAYMSGTCAFIQFMVVLLYHCFTQFFSKTNVWNKIKDLRVSNDSKDVAGLIDNPPENADHRDPLPFHPTFTVLDLFHEDQAPLTGENNSNGEHCYGRMDRSPSWSDTRSCSRSELNENSPLISNSLTNATLYS